MSLLDRLGRRRTDRDAARILRAMAVNPDAEHHGLALAELTGLRPGTYHPALARLESDGLVGCFWEDMADLFADIDEARPRRRLYRLTAEGVRAARELETGS